MTTYNWDSAIPESAQQESRNFPVAVPGTYSFEVMKTEKKTYTPKSVSSKIPTGTPQIDVQLRVEGKDESGKDIETYCFEHLYASDTTVWKATSFAKAIGIYHQGMSFGEIADKAIGEIGTAVVEVHEYNGQRSNRIKKFIEPAQPKAPKIDDSELPF